MEDNKWSPLMEQNWKRMQIILDQELPVQSDKRRNFLAFCFFGGIIFKIVYRQTLPIFKAVNLTLEQIHNAKFSGSVLSAPVIELPDSASTASSAGISKK